MIQIDIVSGFFESGKTTFINRYIKEELRKIYDNVLVISTERGIEDYEMKEVSYLKKEDFTGEMIKELVKSRGADHVVLELNGVWDATEAIGLNLGRGFDIANFITVIDNKTFKSYMTNMRRIMVDKISNSDVVVVRGSAEDENRPLADSTNGDSKLLHDKKINEDVKKAVRVLSPSTRVISSGDVFKSEYINNSQLSQSDRALIYPLVLSLLIAVLIYGSSVFFSGSISAYLSKIFLTFSGLVLQILPFLVIGSLLSSLIQVFLPRTLFLRVFEEGGPGAILLAMFAGILFPVCDCAMIPIVGGFSKKGAPISSLVAFMVASPAVNPVVILSTYYAFSQNLSVVIYRVILGLLIAGVMGFSIYILEKRQVIDSSKVSGEGVYIDPSEDIIYLKGNLERVEAILKHIRNEFFKLCQYVVVGAMFASVFQTLVPKDMIFGLSSSAFTATLILIFLSVFISVCSTSNAFIARSFYNYFPLNSVMAFIVVGPLIEITNLFMLSGIFRKKYVVRYTALIVFLSILLFGIVPLFR